MISNWGPTILGTSIVVIGQIVCVAFLFGKFSGAIDGIEKNIADKFDGLDKRLDSKDNDDKQRHVELRREQDSQWKSIWETSRIVATHAGVLQGVAAKTNGHARVPDQGEGSNG